MMPLPASSNQENNNQENNQARCQRGKSEIKTWKKSFSDTLDIYFFLFFFNPQSWYVYSYLTTFHCFFLQYKHNDKILRTCKFLKEYLLSALKIEALICESFQFDLGRLVA